MLCALGIGIISSKRGWRFQGKNAFEELEHLLRKELCLRLTFMQTIFFRTRMK